MRLYPTHREQHGKGEALLPSFCCLEFCVARERRFQNGAPLARCPACAGIETKQSLWCAGTNVLHMCLKNLKKVQVKRYPSIMKTQPPHFNWFISLNKIKHMDYYVIDKSLLEPLSKPPQTRELRLHIITFSSLFFILHELCVNGLSIGLHFR